MPNEIDPEFLSYSARLGNEPLLIQGAGGNTSVKHDGTLWVKASGKWLVNARDEDMFVAVNYPKCAELIEAETDDPVTPAVYPDQPLRPSIETTLHALLPHRVVVHTHPIAVLLEATRRDGQARLSERLEGLNWCWVDYARPGVDLTRQVKNALSACASPPDILILGSHGLVVGGENINAVETSMSAVLDRLPLADLPATPFAASEQLTAWSSALGMSVAQPSPIHALGTDAGCYRLCKEPPLYPDQAVFLGPRIPTVDNGLDVIQEHARQSAARGAPLAALVIEGHGVLIDAKRAEATEAALGGHVELLRRLPDTAPLRTLTDTELEALLDWEPERYRQLQAQ